MILNYIKIAIRNLRKYRFYTAINVLGLAMGIASSVLIALYVQFEMSYDKHIANHDRIYRIVTNLEANDWAISAFPLGALLQDNFPEVESYTRIKPIQSFMAREGSDNLVEEKLFYADSTIFDVLSVNLIVGDKDQVFDKQNTVVLTKEKSLQIFGIENAVGEMLQLHPNGRVFEVTGILAMPQSSTHAHMEIIASSAAYSPMQDEEHGWDYLTNHYTYVVTPSKFDPVSFGDTISNFLNRRFEVSSDEFGYDIELQALTDIHLHSNKGLEIEANGNYRNIFIFGGIGFLILLVACINFMNLSTAMSLKRAKEVGIRKVLGSHKKQLIGQFLTESVTLSLVGLAIAMLILIFVIPEFNSITGKDLTINPFENPQLLGILGIIILSVGFVAGVYPAFFISGFLPTKVLKGNLATDKGGIIVRKILVIFQFAIAIVIMISTVIINDQLDYMVNKDLGFKKDNILLLRLPNDSIGDATFKQEISRIAEVESAARFNEKPGHMVRTSSIWFEGHPDDQALNMYLFSGDEDLLETLELTLLQGSYFEKGSENYYSEFVINEAAMKEFGWTEDEAVGKQMNFGGRGEGEELGYVIGVIKDFHYKNFENPIEPMVIYLADNYEGRFLALKLNTPEPQIAIEKVKAKWAEVLPEHPFNFEFMDESFHQLFVQERDLVKLFGIFSTLAILISCLGLFGLASFSIEQSKKNMAVRKVLGASIGGLIGLFSIDFLKLVLIGIVIAVPGAWYFMNSWLGNFVFRIELNPIAFIIAGIGAVVIAFVTISYHSLKAALTNPVLSLKEE